MTDQTDVQVTVTISGGQIVGATYFFPMMMRICRYSLGEGILGQVMGKQSADSVDTVSGCTYSSQGFIQAFRNALNRGAGITAKYQSFVPESFMSASDRWCRSWLQLHAEKR